MIPRTSNPRKPGRQENSVEITPWVGVNYSLPAAPLGVSDSKELLNVDLKKVGAVTTRPELWVDLLDTPGSPREHWRAQAVEVVDNILYVVWAGVAPGPPPPTLVLSCYKMAGGDQGPPTFAPVPVSGEWSLAAQGSASLAKVYLLPLNEGVMVFGDCFSPVIAKYNKADDEVVSEKLTMGDVVGEGFSSTTVAIPSTEQHGSQYQFGVELAKYSDDGTVIVRSTSPRVTIPGGGLSRPFRTRVMNGYAGGYLVPERVAIKISPEAWAESTASWDHVVLYRSKNLRPYTNGEVLGVPEELYPIVKVKRSDLLYSAFSFDFSPTPIPDPTTYPVAWVEDEDLEQAAYGTSMALMPFLDLVAITTGTYPSVVGDTLFYASPDGSEVFYSTTLSGRHRGRRAATYRVPVAEPGQTTIRGIAPVGGHLGVFTEKGLWTIPGADPDVPPVLIVDGRGLGLPGICREVPGEGLLLSINQPDELCVLKSTLTITSTLFGRDISKSVTDKVFTAAKFANEALDSCIYDGRLVIFCGHEALVLHSGESCGFSRWTVDLSETTFDSNTWKCGAQSGQKMVAVSEHGQVIAPSSWILPGHDAWYDEDFIHFIYRPIPWIVGTGPLQSGRGSDVVELRRALVQMWYQGVDAPLMTVYGQSPKALWEEALQRFEGKNFLLRPEHDNWVREGIGEFVTQWEWYPKRDPYLHRFWGERMFLEISGEGLMYLTRWSQEMWIQNDRRPGYSGEDRNLGGLWLEYSDGLRHHFGRNDMSLDRKGPVGRARALTRKEWFFSAGEGIHFVSGDFVQVKENNPHLWDGGRGIFTGREALASGGLGVIDPDEYQLRDGGFPYGE